MHTRQNADVAVLIGRFQPFHNGHAALLRRALATAPKVVVVLGSSFHARSAKNPFTWQERAAMISTTLADEERERISFVALRDYYEDARWSNAVREKVAEAAPGAGRVALIGYFKDASSYYLNHFPQWELIAAEMEEDIDATAIRRILFEAEDIDVSMKVIEGLVPATVRQYWRAWTLLPHYAGLVEEHRQIEKYKAAWSAAPYAPIFSTVDAVVKAAGHVLLVKRGGFPGKGLWALPGGFVEPRERLLHSALRELAEETRLGVLASMLEGALIDVKVFDHPDRSQRGRTITHAHFFDLRVERLPETEAADDAAQAVWTPIGELAAMEDMFFEDHFHILNHFLRLKED
ncbi:bifunctional NMN adenylyltransferase/nudix hydrolase [Paucimonas lemoignei]|uniref:Bifunctional NMN adenylyltransferase/nudix hydrolase n=1 Tax=Paucimonas lemoignei TaxID=29443 RepID=A0A4R3HRA4_PAULE|nr:bifunctional nicotinamide-nucleotide adenylyltransferase/Nudix hydroxylase [Paucimonas lemoignei]TCS35637.1 bifunctional NMN adenylyltransferase/nudix hydrolase [Paucimonas lemoignei]